PLYQGIDNLEIVHGRFINGNDLIGQRKVVVIGSKEADQMLEKGVKISTLVGKYLDIGGFIYKIVGIYKSDESVASFVNVTIYAPSTTVSSIYSKGNNIDWIQLTFHGLDTEEKNKEFEENYRRAFNLHHHADPTDTRTIEAYNNAVNRQRLGSVAKKIRKALWILGLLTLISGIVGISNIMLITVKERTHEFGIRKAIGARPAEILKLVIAESITITAFFGYIGMVLGIAANKIMDITMSDKAIDVGIAKATIFVNPGVSMSTAVEATLLLIIAGTIAGMIPAWKATKVKPIEALRAE
ncbi:MAG: FtsX-like permease family protein, partial [Bacteroidales bacterium]|nr:FtsX-like permease family protein [Bacteroidales bacterium]